MSHIILKKKGDKWYAYNKNTKKTEGEGEKDHDTASKMAKSRDEREDKEIDKGAKDEHAEHPEFSKGDAKHIAEDHVGIDKDYYAKEHHMGKGGGGMELHLKKGALHKELDVSEDKKIPEKKLAIHEGDSALEKKRKQFAINAKSWHH